MLSCFAAFKELYFKKYSNLNTHNIYARLQSPLSVKSEFFVVYFLFTFLTDLSPLYYILCPVLPASVRCSRTV